MLFWSLQITVASIIFIFIVHYLINFFTSVLTVPKIKDLVNTPNQKYESMYNTINQSVSISASESTSNSIKLKQPSREDDEYTLIDLLPQEENEKPNMKNELKNFLKKQMNE